MPTELLAVMLTSLIPKASRFGVPEIVAVPLELLVQVSPLGSVPCVKVT